MKLINRLFNLSLYGVGFLSLILTNYVGSSNGCIWFLYEPQFPCDLDTNELKSLNKEFYKNNPILPYKSINN